MAGVHELRSPWSVVPGGAASPAVVCVLNGPLPGRAAAAHAAALARSLGWSLGLVAGGLRPLEPEAVVSELLEGRAGLAVAPVESFSDSGEAVWLAERLRVPLVVVPTGWKSDRTSRPQEVSAHDGRAIEELLGNRPVMIVPQLRPLRPRHPRRAQSSGRRSALQGL